MWQPSEQTNRKEVIVDNKVADERASLSCIQDFKVSFKHTMLVIFIVNQEQFVYITIYLPISSREFDALSVFIGFFCVFFNETPRPREVSFFCRSSLI